MLRVRAERLLVRNLPLVLPAEEHVGVAHVILAQDVGLLLQVAGRIAEVRGQLGRHRCERADEIGKDASIALENGLLVVQRVKRHLASERVHRGFHDVAEVSNVRYRAEAPLRREREGA